MEQLISDNHFATLTLSFFIFIMVLYCYNIVLTRDYWIPFEIAIEKNKNVEINCIINGLRVMHSKLFGQEMCHWSLLHVNINYSNTIDDIGRIFAVPLY